MNERELEQIATLVAEKLQGASAVPLRRVAGDDSGAAVDRSPSLPVRAPRPQRTDEMSALTGGPAKPQRVADFVDHTLLKAETMQGEIDTLCDEARQYRFAAVCVNGSFVKRCAERLGGSGVKVATVVGFPLGAMTSRAKAFEAAELVELGADEIDMVAPIGRILDDDWDCVEADIRQVVTASGGRTVKVILETGTLQPLQVVKASAIAMEAGAHYVKTSTGFHPSGGATPEAVALMRLAVGDRLGVKAAGGVRDCTSALRMIAAGATRLGTSSGVNLVECIGAGPASLERLLADPEAHNTVCRSGACDGAY